MKRLTVLIITVVMLITGCGSAGFKQSKFDSSKIDQSVSDANSAFALNIYKKLNNEDADKNIFISPISISAALTMTYNGAETTTREAMGKALGYNNTSRTTVNESYKYLLNYLKNSNRKVALNIANSIWIKDGEKIKDDFISNNKNFFNAEVTTLDFSKDSSVTTINNWISKATSGNIDKMLEPPIGSNVMMYLVNAIYFKGEWTSKFNPKDTHDTKFMAFDGKEQNIKMMSQKGKFDYAKGDDYKAVKIPYGDGKISMYCILPSEGTNINNFINSVDAEKWKDIRMKLIPVDDVQLRIPKFKMEYGIKNLNDSLTSLGMGEAFSDSADFSGIRNGINISRVLHKAIIEVDEEGSKAAAATVVEMREVSAREPVTFIADRPFIFIVADDVSGTILFMGKLINVE